MITCGIKLTHDGAVAVIENDELLFSVEMEKINNNPRFTEILDTNSIVKILKTENCTIQDIDQFVIDGWGGYDNESLAIQPRLRIGEKHNYLSVHSDQTRFEIEVAQYRERTLKNDILERFEFADFPISGKRLNYESYYHVAGHIMSGYVTSPFAKRNESSYVLVWDGGMFPRLYYFDCKSQQVDNLGPLFLFIGNIYSIFSQHFGPFKSLDNFAKDSLSVAGKVMAYISLGKIQPELIPHFEVIYNEHFTTPMGFANVFANKLKERIKDLHFEDTDILCTFHAYLEQMLIEKLKKKISRNPKESQNLCYVGGCALNIKWNSAIRRSGIFREVYIPPFPNDSGSAIGMAALSNFNRNGIALLNWSVFGGPEMINTGSTKGWKTSECDMDRLASILHDRGEPVIFLDGRAELGPRALGNRSIIAPASSPDMKAILNNIKNREDYRPIAPICLEEEAPGIFDPGCKDPYMSNDHIVREEWKEKIPAVLHLDGTARLQTVSKSEDRRITKLLVKYFVKSGIPLLCNTSANSHGCGFFPDIRSVLTTEMVNYVWFDNELFERVEKIAFREKEKFQVY